MEWEIKRERKRKKDRWNLERLYSLSKKEKERDGISLVRPYFVFVQMYSLSTHRYRSEAPATEVGPNPNSPPPPPLLPSTIILFRFVLLLTRASSGKVFRFSAERTGCFIYTQPRFQAHGRKRYK